MVYHQTSLQALLFTLVHQGPSKSTSQAQCAGYTIKRHFRHLCLHQYIKVHQSQQVRHQSQQVRHSVQGIPSNVTSGTCVYISTSRSIKVNKSGIVAGYTIKRHFRHLCLHQYIKVHQSQKVRHSVQGIPSNVTSGTCVYISTSRSIKVNKSGIVCRVYHQTSLQALVFTLVHRGPSKSTSQAQCAGYTIKRHFRHLCLHQYIKVHQSQQVRHSVQGIPSNVTSGTSVYISTSRSINKSGIVCRVYHQTSLQVFTLVHQGPSKSTSQAQCAGYTIKRHFRYLCLHQYIKVHQSQQVRHSVQGIPSNVTSGTCVYISTSKSIKVNKSGIVCRVYHQTSLQALVFTLVHQGPSKSTSQAQCAGYTIKRHFRHLFTLVHRGPSKSTSQAQCAGYTMKRHFRHLCLHQYIKVHQSQQVRHSVQGIPSNVISCTCVYISTSRSIKVNKSGIVCRVYHQTSLQALVFTLVHQGPSKSTSQAQCAGYTIKRHFRHLCLHQYIKVHQSQQVRHSVQGIPSNVTSGTFVYISTSKSIKVNKSGIVCRVYHQTSLQALVFTLVHQGPSKSTSQAQSAGYTKRHFRHLCLHQYIKVHQSQQVRHSVQGIPSNVISGTCVYISTSRSIKVNKSGIVCKVYHQTSLQALVFTLVHQSPSKSTSQAQCAGHTIKRHFRHLCLHQYIKVHQSQQVRHSLQGYTIKRHFRHLCLHQYIKVHQSQKVRHSVQGIPSNVTSGTCIYISTSRSIKVKKSGIMCRVYHQTSLQALLFTLVHRGPSKSTSQAQCAGYTIKRHFRHLCLYQYIEIHQSQQVRHSVQDIPSNVTSGTSVYISTSRSIKVNKSGIVYRLYHQTSLQALVFTLVYQGPSKSTSQAQCEWYTIKRHFRHFCLHQYIKVHQSQQVRHSVQAIPSNVTSGTCVYISTSRSIKVNKSGVVCRVYHQTSLQALLFTISTSRSIKVNQSGIVCRVCHQTSLQALVFTLVHQGSKYIRHSVQSIPSNVTSGTCVYISQGPSVKKSGIVCRVYHQTSLQALLFSLVHQVPSKSTSQAQCAGYTIKRHFRHFCLHQYIKVHQSQQVRHSVKGIPSNVTSGTCVYISTSRSIKVNKSGIVCRVYHQTSLQALVFTLVHQSPSKSTSQAQCAGYTIKRHFRHLCLHQYIKVHQSQQVRHSVKGIPSNVTSGTCVYISTSRSIKVKKVRHSVQGIPSNVTSGTCVYISTSRSIKVKKSGIVCKVYHQTSLQALVFTLVHQGPSKSTSQAQCAGYTIKRHFRHFCLHQYIKVHQSQQVRHSVQGIPSNVTSGTCVYISTSRSIKGNKSGIVCRVYHQTSLQALLFTLVHQGPSKSTSQAQCTGYIIKRHFRHLCLHQYIKVHQSQQVRHSVNGIPSNVTSGTCVYISTSRSIKVNKSGIVCRVYHQTSLQALLFTLVHQGPSKSTSQAQCVGYTIKRHFRHLCLHQYIKVHQSQQVRHSVNGIPSNVTSGTSVYISTSRSIKVNKSGIVCRLYHQTSLQALVFTLVHQGPSKSTSQAQCAGYTIKRHFRHFCLHQYFKVHQSQQVRQSVEGMPSNVTSGTSVYISTSRSIKVKKSGIVCRVYHQTSLQALVFTLVHQGPSKSTSQAQCAEYTIKRHFRHLCLHQYFKVHQSQEVRHSVQGIPSNVTSGTSVFISTSRSIKVNKSGIVCRVYHQTSLQALLFTLVHQGPSKSTSQAQCKGYTIKRHFRHFCLHQYIKVHQSQKVRHSVQGIPSNVISGTCVYISTSRSIKVNKSGIVCRVYHQTSLQALVFTLVHQSPSKSTSQAQCAGYTIKRHFRHLC